MALEGNLSSFGLEEILQLVAVQQKTGMLSVTANERSAVLFFRDGKIISTRDRRSKARDPFREYLTRYGCLKREELVRITQISSQSKLDLIDILSSEGLLDERALNRHWRNHIQETLHEVLTWDQLSYKFISGDEVVSGVKAIGEHLVEPLLMECMRRIDEYPMLLQMFPGDGARIAATGAQPDPEAEMIQNEKSVLELVKAPRALNDVIAHAKLPAFDVYEALKLLKEKKLIAVEADAGGATSAEAARAARVVRPRRGSPLVLLAMSFVFMACLMFGAWRNADHVVRVASDGVLSRDLAARDREEGRMRFILEAYRAETGAYPSSLEQLRERGFADRAALNRADDLDIRYKLTRDGSAYTLL